jgi:hypothetical protein
LLYSKPKKFIKHKKKTTKLNRYLKITFSGEHSDFITICLLPV